MDGTLTIPLVGAAGLHGWLDAAGSFNASVSIDWGFTFTASMAVSTSGSFDFCAAFHNLGLSQDGYGLTGSFRVHVWGTSSTTVSFFAGGTAEVELADVTVSSASKITVSCSTWFGTVSVTI